MAAVDYRPPDSVIIDRIKRPFPSDELRERARATNLVQREHKFNTVALFYALSLGFAAGSDRSIQAFLERFVEMADCDELTYPTFHGWFSPAFVTLLREILDDAIENLEPGQTDLTGRLESVRDVLIVDASIVSLYQDATDVYATTGEDQTGVKLHLTESLSTGLPARFQTTTPKRRNGASNLPASG